MLYDHLHSNSLRITEGYVKMKIVIIFYLLYALVTADALGNYLKICDVYT